MKKKTSRPLLTAGTSTLLLIFLSLCLLTFAVLSLLSARADRNLSRKTADRTTAYYEACNQAENRIGEIDGILEKIWKNTEGKEMYFQEIEISSRPRASMPSMPWLPPGTILRGCFPAWRMNISGQKRLMCRISPSGLSAF